MTRYVAQHHSRRLRDKAGHTEAQRQRSMENRWSRRLHGDGRSQIDDFAQGAQRANRRGKRAQSRRRDVEIGTFCEQEKREAEKVGKYSSHIAAEPSADQAADDDAYSRDDAYKFQ
ncbi:hypothetical protein [Mesorhizobium sp.]|uniref:hypothetical protein n=1 Tax=Mesorhizobium sp. TaxID=1871066 RepID=UPI0025BE882B|nr:hypothetical protein [Mesorhizobium sp.]